MKYHLIRYFFKFLKKIQKIQIGNPANTPPVPVLQPKNEEKIYSHYSEAYGIFAWNLKNTICTSLYWGAIINSENLVYLLFTRFPWGKELHPVFFSPYLGKKTSSLEKAVFIIATDAKGNYFHWMIDLLPRLLLIANSNWTDFSQRNLILYHKPERSYELETLNLLGIQKNKVLTLKAFELASVQDLVTTEFSPTYETTPFPGWKKELLTEFKIKSLGNIASKEFKQIYLLRGRQGKRRLLGEERLVDVLRARGFHILDPQRMTVVEQMEALSGAEVVVAPHGAALTNIIFCKEQTVVIELRSTNIPPEFFSEIAKTCNLKFHSISLPPEYVKKHKHDANKQNLVLTEEGIDLLIVKLNALS